MKKATIMTLIIILSITVLFTLTACDFNRTAPEAVQAPPPPDSWLAGKVLKRSAI